MNDLMTIVINPEGTRQRVPISEAILAIEEKEGRLTCRFRDKIDRTPEAEKAREKQRKYYQKLKEDPIRWERYCLRYRDWETDRKSTRLNSSH